MIPQGEVLAVIRDAKYGVLDNGAVGLSFTAYTQERYAALQILLGDEATEAIKAAEVSDVSKLNGRVCWVLAERGRIKFVRMWDQVVIEEGEEDAV